MIESIVRHPFCRVLIGGQEISNRLFVGCSFGFDQQTSAATIQVPEFPDGIQLWDTVEIHMGATQASSRLRFRGMFVETTWELWPKAVTLQCRGMLALAELNTNSDEGGMSFAAGGLGTPDEEQVEAVLTACGVTDMDIEGTGTNIGSIAVDEVVWEEGQSGLAYIQRLDEVCLGYRTYDAAGGTVVRRQISPRPSSSSALSFTEGEDIFTAQRHRTPIEIRNRVYVTGFDNGDGAVFAFLQQESAGLPPGVDWVTHDMSSTLIERTNDESPGAGLTAMEVAEWKLLDLNVIRERVPFDTPRDDLIVPGMTIQVVSPNRLGTTANYWVQNVSITYSQDGNFTQSIIAYGGLGSDSDIEAPPLIDFIFRVELEKVYIEGSLVNLWIIYAEDVSVGQSAEIVSRDWSLPGGNPDAGEGLTFVSALTSLSGAALTLTITDSNGLQGSRTKSVDVPDSEQKRRRMFTAAETHMEAFDGDVWRVQPPGNEEAVSEVAHGPLWIAGEFVYRTETMLSDPPDGVIPFWGEQDNPAHDPENPDEEIPETIIVATANPTAIWAELDADENLVMAGASDGRVAVSTDGALTWEIKDGPQTDNVVRCVISRFSPNHLYVMYADALWESHDGGINWQRLVRNHPETNEVFRDLNVSFMRMMIAMENGRLLIDGRSDAQQILPELDPPITEVRCVTADIRADKFFAIDQDGRTLATIEPGGIEWEQRVSVPEGTQSQWRGLWRDGDVPGLLYMALGTGGVWKSIDGFQTVPGYYQMRAPGASNSPATAIHRRVGLDGRLQDAPPTGRVYVLGIDGIAVRIARNNWAQLNQPNFPVGTTNRLMMSSSGDADRLFVLSNNGHIARSIDGGVNWTILSHGISNMDAAGSWISPGFATMTIYAGAGGAGGSGLWRSTDGGDNWTQIHSGATYQVRDFDHRIWYGGTLGLSPTRHVRYTDDDFTNSTAAGFSGGVGGLGGRFAASAGAPGTVYHWRQNPGTVFQRWRDTGEGPTNVKPFSVGDDGTVRWAEAAGANTVLCAANLAGGGSAVFRSTNQGDSWSTVIGSDLISGGFGYEQPRITVNPTANTEWWVVEGDPDRRRVFHSTDEGMTWEAEICNIAVGSTIRQILATGGASDE